MKIGLLSVSGVRITNDRLRRYGVTLPGFYERARTIASMPSLGLLTLAGATPAKHDLTYLEVPEFRDDLPPFDLVAVTSFTAKSDVMYRIADAYRARGTTVVLGGLHATLVPHEAAGHADAVVLGEGERAWPRVLEDWEAGRLRKSYRLPGSLDVLPRYDLLDMDRYNRIPIQTTRGCPLACEFCAASRTFSPYRRKAIDLVRRDLREVKKHWRHPFIELADDNTFVHKPWSKELVRAIAEEEVHWFTETDVSVADDPELLDLLAQSGCRQVLIGFESPNAPSLEGIEWKRKRVDGYRRAIDALQTRGVSVNGCFIVGFDHDTPSIFEEVERFVKSTALVEAQVTVLTPFPGTALYGRLRAEGRLLRERYWERCTLFDVNFVPKRMTVEQLEQGLEYLMGALYSPEEVRRRRRCYMDLLRRAS